MSKRRDYRYGLHNRHPLKKFYENKKEIMLTEDGFKVKTLCLTSLAQKVNRDHLFYHFSAFGVVESVQVLKKPSNCLGFVTFTQADSAANAMSGRFHEIAGQRTKVTVGDSWHQNAPTRVDLPLKLSNATGKHILELNDDCLNEIFSLKLVSINDLCSLAETCTRFKGIAKGVFKNTLKICHLGSLRTTLHETRRMLINFGPLISELWIGDLPFENARWLRLTYLVITYCGNTLQSLHLNDCNIPEHLTARLRPLIRKLRKLSIENCIISGADMSLFTNCATLEELEIKRVFDEDMDIIFENTFPKLVRFECEDNTYFDCEGFISRHTKLKALSIKSSHNFDYLLPIVAKNCKELEKLQVKCRGAESVVQFETALMSIIIIHNLKELAIHCANRNVTKFSKGLMSLKSLESLELLFAEGDTDLITTLSQLKNLKVLRLTDCSNLKNLNPLVHLDRLNELSIQNERSNENNDIDVVSLIRHLVNLKTLILKTGSFKMDKTTYLKIISVFCERWEIYKQTLQIVCSADNDVGILQKRGNNRMMVNVLLPQPTDDGNNGFWEW